MAGYTTACSACRQEAAFQEVQVFRSGRRQAAANAAPLRVRTQEVQPAQGGARTAGDSSASAGTGSDVLWSPVEPSGAGAGNGARSCGPLGLGPGPEPHLGVQQEVDGHSSGNRTHHPRGHSGGRSRAAVLGRCCLEEMRAERERLLVVLNGTRQRGSLLGGLPGGSAQFLRCFSFCWLLSACTHRAPRSQAGSSPPG